ncbi:DUF58 domain-containing protein [Maledivibacter halophilus]|uniref:Uncharacterized conserved protein (Some members contain a von Willebrand factor type A (VWA) domain) n=1 Tax=Maledivibacter halophilus TaxID=36842 RepID=A0A1T5J2W8_9FIRM|nr:DUF58 domain-containing protein [Maledivibacter halophilus]SKC45795.1 Uncharacterized conserved protein (some members contain a von Willebrand factor type A (vWA) domain) [Maledivibacter halophilus]
MEKFLQEIEQIIIKRRKRLINGQIGNRKSKRIGSSQDFYGHRIYNPGDDTKKIDWKAYPRTGKFYIREFTAQKQMEINIILDCSGSMDFGNPNKFQLAELLSIGLAYISINQRDKLNIYTINKDVEILRKNLNNKYDFYELLNLIKDIKPKGETNFYSLSSIEKIKEGVTFIITDLFGKNFSDILDYLSSKKQDIIVIHLMAPQEIKPDFSGELKLIDKETGESRKILLTQGIKEKYKKKIRNFIEDNKKICDYRDVKYVFSPSDSQPINIIAKAVEVI